MYGRARPALDEVVASVWNVPGERNDISFSPTAAHVPGKNVMLIWAFLSFSGIGFYRSPVPPGSSWSGLRGTNRG